MGREEGEKRLQVTCVKILRPRQVMSLWVGERVGALERTRASQASSHAPAPRISSWLFLSYVLF